MSKTIKDMAISFGWTQNEDGRGYAAFCFAQGAKAILSEIETIIEEYSEYYPGNNESFISYNVLIGKIKELKGE